ncbi:MAG: aminotransferase class I/II-fold pyridoxal phosphate-dependent enzyme [Anaerolineales bacterium]|nr:aminotransferase class I/II-fold pyridoxal phosphate-dependent enzyme [Anaerolineales bacterium]
MQIAPFTIEQFFAVYEFTTPYLLCSSDCESMTVGELLEMAERPSTSLSDLHLGYTETQGSPALRAQVAALYPALTPDDVVVLTAPEEGIFLALHTVLEPGDHVVVLTPAYDSLLNLAEHVSGNVSRWEVEAGNGRWQLNLQRLETLVTDQTKLLIVNFPHNPTGLLPTLSEFQAIIDIARRHNAWLFCDEMYRGLEASDDETLPSAATLYERAIVLSGLSKVHGLPGLRAGWLLIRDADLRGRLINWKHYTTICPPAPSEFLAQAALDAQDKLVARSRAIIAANLQTAEAFFSRWPEMFDWRPPQAGSVALVGLNVPSATDYCHKLAAESGILLLPSICLGYGDRHVRLGLGRRNFAANLERFETYLEAHRGGPI